MKIGRGASFSKVMTAFRKYTGFMIVVELMAPVTSSKLKQRGIAFFESCPNIDNRGMLSLAGSPYQQTLNHTRCRINIKE